MSTCHETVQNQNLNTRPRFHLDQYHSVEFSVENVKFLYQFKIWRTPELPFFVIVKKGSHIMKLIKAGDVLNMRYYTGDVKLPTQLFSTKILDIRWQDQGRFNDHYMISMDTVDDESHSVPDPPQDR
ncbi:MAG: hypothetical protein JRH15_19820 [Deltaproteobacteria bacterium]|nr:hypothetical protein [Deltaproteobacteria bacterium]